MKRLLLTLLPMAFVALLSGSLFAQGLIINPPDRRPPEPPPHNWGVRIVSHQVEVTIADQVATTTITQVFHNPTGQMLEGTYLFPLPEQAAISEFAMTMNGEMVTGEVLEANRAREIYERIVRQIRDPGLLEYVGRNLFRARIFPVTPRGNTTVRLQYSEILPLDNQIVSFRYPLNTTAFCRETIERVSMRIDIRSAMALRSVYSPTHDMEIVRDGEHHATAGFEAQGIAPNRDFRLYYTVAEEDFAVNVVTYNTAGEDGYFMAMVAPRTDVPMEEVLPKDVLFVFDTSGSMSDSGKIDQAKGSLRYCLSNLNPQDRFNIIRFSTLARPYRDSLVSVSEDTVADALQHVDTFRATGGTDINDALTTTLGMVDGATDRMTLIVFMTDGLPTLGTTDVGEILNNSLRAAGERDLRLFTFGFGHDVNTHLLDQLARQHRAVSDYVAPAEDLEVRVSAFFDKVSRPVMTNLSLGFGEGVRVFDIYPRTLPDLFAGTQLIVLGRYSGHGAKPVILRGTINGEQRDFVSETTFAENDASAEFLPRLWAVRKVGYLLDQIRLHGVSEEVRQTIIELGTRFGIVTPYTSFLVVEDTPVRRDPPPPGWRGDDDLRRRPGGAGAVPNSVPAPAEEAPADREELERESQDEGAQSGERAVERARGTARMARAESLGQALDGEADGDGIAPRAMGERTFLYRRGWWIDTTFSAEAFPEAERVEVETWSDAYFELLRRIPELARYASLGEYLVVVYDGTCYIFKPAPTPEDEGDDTPSEDGR